MKIYPPIHDNVIELKDCVGATLVVANVDP